MLTQAEEWVAVFAFRDGAEIRYTREPVACWVQDGANVYGLIAGRGGLARPENRSGFYNYQFGGATRTVSAQAGWWAVQRTPDGRGWWHRVIVWLVIQDGASLQAVVQSGTSPISSDDNARFIWDPDRTTEGEGDWPTS
jgi:hypothetical protein